MYSGKAFQDLNIILLLLIVFGFGFFVYKNKKPLYSYLFAVGVAFQMIVVTAAEFEQYYYYLILIFPIYLLSIIIKEDAIRLPLKYVSIAAVFIFGIYQTFMLQESWITSEITFELRYFIAWAILFILGIALKIKMKQEVEVIELVLFLPIMYLPIAYLLGLITLFIFSLGWIFIGNMESRQHYVMLGTGAFLLSTLTAYIQFAWDTIDRSLFFFIGGILLFLISFIIEKQRRKLSNVEKRSAGK